MGGNGFDVIAGMIDILFPLLFRQATDHGIAIVTKKTFLFALELVIEKIEGCA